MTLNLSHVRKSFGPTIAVDDVSLSVGPGEIVGLVGENGAGKTTLMRILAGEIVPDAGSISIGGAVGFVHQHFMLVSEFSIAENLALVAPSPGLRPPSPRFAGRGSTRSSFSPRRGEKVPEERVSGRVTSSRAALAPLNLTGATQIIAESGIRLERTERRVHQLSVGEKAKLELIKAIARRPRILILDEPTSVLTPSETSELFDVARQLAAGGTSVLLISHKIREVLAIATRTVVMRRGRVVADGQGMTAEELARAMVDIGESVEVRASARAGRLKPVPTLEIQNLTVSPGEIVAIIGVAGNGQTQLAETLRDTLPHSTAAHIPEDRSRDGLIAQMSIAENIALAAGLRGANERARRLIETFGIRATGPKQRAGSLSGGNQQKLLLARELDRHPEVIVAAEPTRGLDLEATRFVHEQLRAAADRGAAILLITSDLDEAFALGSAVHVIYRGRLSQRLTPMEAATRAGSLMAGLE